MDCVFFLEEEARAALLKVICRVIGCAYICLWSYPSPSSNFLICKDGWYHEEESDQTGSSPSASLVHRLFKAYRETVCNTRTGFVPGYVSREGLPCLELRDSELLSLAAVEIQRQFYQEARIKVAAFLGCGSGEIELGMSTPKQDMQINLQMEVTNLLTEIFQQTQQVGDHQLPQSGGDQNRPSSSSSSLISLSMGSPENSSLVFSIPTTSSFHDQLPLNMQQQLLPQAYLINQEVLHPKLAYTARNRHVVEFPSSANNDIDAAMTRAMLAVISSSSSFSSSRTPRRTGAFRPYNMGPALRVNMQAQLGKSNSLQRDNNILRRAFAFLRHIPRRRIFDHDHQAPGLQGTRPTPHQMQHMITERRRREKLNEYFDALRGVLPPGIKKHKASVLSGTIEMLESLKAQVSELKKKNTALQARLDQPNSKEATEDEGVITIGNDERVRVEIMEASEAASSSSEREMELQVTVREDVCTLMDLAIRLLERLKQMNNIVGMISVEARTQLRDSNSFHRVTIRLRIQASDWKEQTFKEAMTRAAEDDAAP